MTQHDHLTLLADVIADLDRANILYTTSLVVNKRLDWIPSDEKATALAVIVVRILSMHPEVRAIRISKDLWIALLNAIPVFPVVTPAPDAKTLYEGLVGRIGTADLLCDSFMHPEKQLKLPLCSVIVNPA